MNEFFYLLANDQNSAVVYAGTFKMEFLEPHNPFRFQFCSTL